MYKYKAGSYKSWQGSKEKPAYKVGMTALNSSVYDPHYILLHCITAAKQIKGFVRSNKSLEYLIFVFMRSINTMEDQGVLAVPVQVTLVL